MSVDISLSEAEQFVYREARLADSHDYDGWEALWTDDAVYWVPAGGNPPRTRQVRSACCSTTGRASAPGSGN